MRLNLEIAGIAAFALAILLSVALVAPHHSGAFGLEIARLLHSFFGLAAGFFPILVFLIAGIVFLEINVPRLILTFGGAATAYFLIIVALLRGNGGSVGRSLFEWLASLLGGFGASLVLGLVALSLTVALTNVSLKRIIGWMIARGMALRAYFAAKSSVKSKKSAANSLSPRTLREAFHLPALVMRPKNAAGVSAGSAVEIGGVFVGGVPAASVPVVPVPTESAEETDDDEDVEDEELEDEEEFEDEDEFDEENEEDEEPDEGDEADDDDDQTDSENVAPVIVGVAKPRVYRLPSLSLFDLPAVQIVDETTRASVLEDTLSSFGVGAKVIHIERGPSVTRYELKPERGVKISRISSLADDLALALAATSVRIEAPIPGKSAVGIEIPNANVSIVSIREILEAMPSRGTVPPLNMALGKDITGRAVFGDLGKMPHLLVAGATGSGKSVCLNGIIASLLASATPDQVQMLFIDPKRVELTVYNGIPHLIKDVITDARLAAGALHEMTREMDSRYERFARAGVRKIEEYNTKFPDEKLPYVVIVIDELADLMMVAPARVETTIMRIAQLARATGIHLIVATQRPSVDVITGLIKANIPSRIAFAVSSQVDSRTILDMVGAERLLGRGDMLYLPIDAPKPVRAQGALITGTEVHRLVEFWSAQARPENLLDVDVSPIDEDDKGRNVDPLCYDAAKFIIESSYASTAQLQSRLSIGHPRAVRVMKQLEEFGIVGPHEGTKPRRINIGLAELETISGRLGRTTQADLFDDSL
ncbi:MAG TPA: DNA translocase FtsK [Candidatus Baltobacteraceae bacterium]|jgi:DNA segregation ATPase FtsK/SpoIIIE-like protein|nr:DNA translocase FtsK [Candidatus Baltobacteraceae bacterium]